MKKLKNILLKKGDIVYYIFHNKETSIIIGEQFANKTVSEVFGDEIVTKIERPVQYKTIYEAPKQILDKKEKEYLEAVIRPFKNRVKYIEKEKIDFYSPTNEFLSEYIYIDLGDNDESFPLPRFKSNTMYKEMERNKEYTLKELRLFE